MQVGRANRNSGRMLLLLIVAALIAVMIWLWMTPSRKGAEPVSKPLHSEKSHQFQVARAGQAPRNFSPRFKFGALTTVLLRDTHSVAF
jgi:hypothetical protein